MAFSRSFDFTIRPLTNVNIESLVALYNEAFPKYPIEKGFEFFRTFLPNISTIVLSIPFPVVFILTLSSNIRVIAVLGFPSASCTIISFIFIYSVVVFLKNFNLAGVLKNKSFISIVVPTFLCISLRPVIFPPETVIADPVSSSLVREDRVIFDTADIEDRASPLNPYVKRLYKSSFLAILLVACLSTERSRSS